MSTTPSIRHGEHDPSVAKIAFGDGSFDAKHAASKLLALDTTDHDYTYAGHHPGMSKHIIWALLKESNVSIESYLPQIHAEAEAAALDAETEQR